MQGILNFISEHTTFVGCMTALVVIAVLAGWSDYLDRKYGERF